MEEERKLKDYLVVSLKGIGMGAADVVPGVSGGTIAFITGIYDELIGSIKSVLSKESIQHLMKFDIKGLWNHINGNFLFTLLFGVGLSVISLAKLMGFLLKEYPVLIWSFFFGLIISSAILVGKRIKNWNPMIIISGIIGTIISYAITILSPANTPEELWFIFISGCIAICAMILPGISGSFILLLMGKYEYIINSLSSLNFKVIITFILGCGIGILSFSHLLNWLLKKYHDITVALLAGFMVGSLNKVWPWKETLETYLDRHGELKPLKQINISPTGENSEIIFAFALMFFGFILVLGFEKFSDNKAKFVENSN